MLHLHWTSRFSPKYHHLQQPGSKKTLQSPVTSIHGFLNRSQDNKYSIKCFQSSFYLASKIRSNKYSVPVTSQNDCASGNKDDKSRSFQDFLQKKLNVLARLARPFTLIGIIVGITSICALPLQSFADLTPKYFVGSLTALVSATLMNTYVATLNQLTDVEIDKVNKPDLPIAAGELSMGTGIAITLTCALMSLAIAIRLQSPPLVFGLIVWFLLGAAYSIDLPFLRWKTNPFLTAMCIVIAFGFVYHFPFFMHIQKYVLGRPVVISRPLISTAAIMCCFSSVMALLKDIPDEEGDKKFSSIRSLSVRIGKEKVSKLV